MKALPSSLPATAGALLLLGSLGAACADTVNARCDIHPKGSDTVSKVVACTFSQRQGHVAIDRADGVRHELSPQGAPGNYVDGNGQKAIRSKGLGSEGQIYRLAKESIFVYWDTLAMCQRRWVTPADADVVTIFGGSAHDRSARLTHRGLTVSNRTSSRPAAGPVGWLYTATGSRW